MGSALSWPDDGLGEGVHDFGRGAQAPPPPHGFLGKFYLLNFFFFGPSGGPSPLSLLPGSVPEKKYDIKI